MHEIKEVLDHLGFEHEYEEKAYPRDLTQYGRFRVSLRDPKTGEPMVDGIATRRQLLLKLAELITGLKSRKEAKIKPSATAQGIALPGYPATLIPVIGAQAAAAPPGLKQSGGAGSSGTSSGSSKKKKGR